MDKDTPILITGATGFIGSHLLRQLLSAGYTHIRALRRPGSSMDLVEDIASQAEWKDGDILDIFELEEAMQGQAVVFHCAAIVSFDPAEAEVMLRANVEGTANVVNAALHLGGIHLIYVSSIAALGRSKEGVTIDETAKWERSPFNTRYAISKFQGEMEVWRGQAEGLQVAVVNPSIVLGPGDWSAGPPRFFQTVWDGIRFYPAGTTGLVDVEDVARFMQMLMEKGTTGERYILNAEHYTYKRLLTEIAEALGKKPPTLKVGPIMRRVAWRLAWLQAKLTGGRPFLTKETAKNSSLTFYYDHSKSLRDFDFEYTPIAETIRRTARKFEKLKS
jgi:nucleoside-diphosphate-sugar epimerase